MPTTPEAGVAAPDLKVPLIIGTEWELAKQDPRAFTMINVYRGLHCPVCQSHLKTLKGLYDQFIDKGVEVLNVSMDTEEQAREAHEGWDLGNIPMGYGLSEAQAADWGLYLSEAIKEDEPDIFAEPGLFLVRPDGTLHLAVVSNSPFARPDLEALLGRIDFIVEKSYPARGTKAA